MRTILFAASAALTFAGAAHAITPQEQIALSQAATSAAIVQALQPPVKAPAGPTSVADWVSLTSAPVSAQNAATSDQASVNSAASGSSATTIDIHQRQPVATAYAAPLTFSQGTCYVSASAGGQGVTFGLSAAIPVEDRGCTIRANAQALAALGAQAAALEYLRQNVPGVAKALEATKTLDGHSGR